MIDAIRSVHLTVRIGALAVEIAGVGPRSIEAVFLAPLVEGSLDPAEVLVILGFETGRRGDAVRAIGCAHRRRYTTMRSVPSLPEKPMRGRVTGPGQANGGADRPGASSLVASGARAA